MKRKREILIINGEQVTKLNIIKETEFVKVIDNYFPQFIVDDVSQATQKMPVAYTNSPYRHFHLARFFGAMLYNEDKFADVGFYWFVDYFNRCIMNDVCKDLSITNCHRILLNLQLENQNGQNHTDSDSDDYLSIIYMASGNSGDTVISDGENDIERVSFKEGRLVIFKSNIWHRGEAPTEGHRVTLGAVYPLFKV